MATVSGTLTTLIVTRDGVEEMNPLFTVRVKPRVPGVAAVKVGLTAVVPPRATAVPETCRHRYVIGKPAGSELRLPLSVTARPGLTLWPGPALAMGAPTGFTVMLTREAAEVSRLVLVTLRENVSTVDLPFLLIGAVNDGVAAVALDSVTGGHAAAEHVPKAVWVQA